MPTLNAPSWLTDAGIVFVPGLITVEPKCTLNPYDVEKKLKYRTCQKCGEKHPVGSYKNLSRLVCKKCRGGK